MKWHGIRKFFLVKNSLRNALDTVVVITQAGPVHD